MAHVQTLYDENGNVKAYKAIVNRKTGDVKRPSKTFSVKKYGKKKAKEKAEMWKARNMVRKDEGTFVDPKKITFSEFLDRWLENHKKPNVANTTYDNYKYRIEGHIKPYFKDARLQDIEPVHIEEYFARKRKSGRKDGKDGGLSENTLKKHYVLMNSAFKRAIKLKLIKFNPVQAIDPPKPEKHEAQVMSQEEFHKLIKTAHKEDKFMHALIGSLLFTGMRRSEALGLEWPQVDFKERTIRIIQVLVPEIGKGAVLRKTTKNDSSRRTIKISRKAAKLLRRHKKRQAEIRLQLRDEYNTDYQFVFCKPDGTHYYPTTVNRKLNKLLDKAGLSQEFGLHTLRHTFATLNLKNETDLEIIKDMLGHSTIATTADIYLHPDLEEQEKAADKLDSSIDIG